MPSLQDRAAIRAILQTDPQWAVYALGDLEPDFFVQCSWFGVSAGTPALALLFRGFGTPVLFTMGETSALKRLLVEIGEEPTFYLHVRPEVVPLLRARYRIAEERKMWRMVLQPDVALPSMGPAVSRLGPKDLAEIECLYADGMAAGEAPDFFFGSMVEDGVFYGIREERALIAVAGTHLVAPNEKVAAIGNVYTRRDRRGQGFAAQVTGAVAGELLRLGIRIVALNVNQQNAAGIRVYERLGFVRYCQFCEGVGRLLK